MSDPDVEREERIARDHLATILRPRLVAGVDPDAVAAHYIAWLRGHRGWWPPLRPPAETRRPTDDQAVAVTRRGAELARKLLTTPREDNP
jgi:hypothetical protein